MKKSHKNELFQKINLYKIGIENFVLSSYKATLPPIFRQQIYDIDEIRYKETKIFFKIINPNDNSEKFGFSYSTYPEYYEDRSYTKWTGLFWQKPTKHYFIEILSELERWVRGSVIPYWQEENEVDMWERFLLSKEFVDENKFDDKSEFSHNEKIYIKAELEKIKALIIERFSSGNDQKEFIEARIDYLIEGVDRLNKFDLKSIIISTAIGIATNLSLDTENGRQLISFFTNLFKKVYELAGI